MTSKSNSKSAVDAATAMPEPILKAWEMFYALDNSASDRAIVSPEQKLERENNRSVVRVNVAGFAWAFCETRRTYVPEKRITRFVSRLIVYDEQMRRMKHVKKSLTLVANGDVTWHVGDKTTAIPATWRNAKAMTPAERDAAFKAVQNTFDKWGINQITDFVIRDSGPKFEVFEIKVG